MNPSTLPAFEQARQLALVFAARDGEQAAAIRALLPEQFDGSLQVVAKALKSGEDPDRVLSWMTPADRLTITALDPDEPAGHLAPASLAKLTIRVGGRPLPDITAEALAALVRDNETSPTLFVRGGELVEVRVDEAGRPAIRALSRAAVRGHLARSADYYRLKGEHEVAAFPPMDLVDDLMALGSWPLPPLEAVTESPTLRPDGSLLSQPGYDRATRLFYRPQEGFALAHVPDHPTAQDVQAALALLNEALGDFPFDSEASYANALATLLTPAVRPIIDGNVPLAGMDAPTAGTGKTLLASVISTVTTGSLPAVMSECSSEEEWAKVITSQVMRGAGVIIIDNIEGELKSGQLAAAMTSRVWSARALGRNEMIELPQRAVWMATGNNIRFAGDLARRSFWIRLDPKVARPWQRTGFKHPALIPWVLEHRPDVLAALLTLARAWFAAGQPAPSVKPLGSFEEWTRIVGGILEYAGVRGFLGNLEEMYEMADGDTQAWEAFLAAWHQDYGERAVTVAEVAKRLKDEQEWMQDISNLRAALPDELADALAKRGNAFQVRLGKALSAKRDRRYGPLGLAVQKGPMDTHNKTVTWRVRSLGNTAGAGAANPCAELAERRAA